MPNRSYHTAEREGSVIPEGPELRRSADVLQRFVGRRVVRAFRRGGRYAMKEPVGYYEWCMNPCMHDTRIHAIDVKGKLMWWRLGPESDPPAQRWHMFCTYGMTGGWTTQALADVQHPAFVVSFDPQDSETLTFDDQRHFGTIKFVQGDAALTRKLATLGPDMLTDPPDALAFTERLLHRPTRTLAESLMDQSTVSGVGNYVKAESLWHARLSPHRTVLSLAGSEMITLHGAIVHVMRTSYKLGGATIESYRDPDGNTGHATHRFACYGRRTDADGSRVISEETLDGRTTWWSPTRQS